MHKKGLYRTITIQQDGQHEKRHGESSQGKTDPEYSFDRDLADSLLAMTGGKGNGIPAQSLSACRQVGLWPSGYPDSIHSLHYQTVGRIKLLRHHIPLVFGTCMPGVGLKRYIS